MMSRLLVTALLTLAWIPSATAQNAFGSVRGIARSEQGGNPIPFVLVRLLPSDSTNATGRQSITNAQGRFQFESVPAGAYRLQLLRIGYRPVLSPVIEVRSGETSEHELRASMIAIPLPPVIVYGEGTCLTGERVAADPYLLTLWEEVRQGVEIRRAFDRRYRYKRMFGQASDTRVPSRPALRRQRADTVINEPDSVDTREERARARRASEGFGRGNVLTLPDEKELTADTFLRTHCIVPPIVESNGASGLRFREASRGRGFGIQGTIWVDADRLMQRIDLEYLNDGKSFSTVSIDYADVAIASTTLRLPIAGSFSIRPLEAPRGTTATGTLFFGYSSFEEIRPSAPDPYP
ncbi:MAG TPA: carboxypeptidase-like regulatory domain-containing protein [Gemmatimonadaceae bacterium]